MVGRKECSGKMRASRNDLSAENNMIAFCSSMSSLGISSSLGIVHCGLHHVKCGCESSSRLVPLDARPMPIDLDRDRGSVCM